MYSYGGCFQGHTQAGCSVVFLAHSKNDRGRGIPEALQDHLRFVSARAEGFAAALGATDEARVAGLLHDLGKYSHRFQRRLQGLEPGMDHWSAGAAIALGRYGAKGLTAALAIRGHHQGLDHIAGVTALREKLAAVFERNRDHLTDVDLKAIWERFSQDELSLPESLESSLGDPAGPAAAEMLDVRMLLSALVDADYLETEAHFEGDARQPRRDRPAGPMLQAEQSLEILQAHLASLSQAPTGAPAVQSARDALYHACLAAAAEEPGLFTLSAPTGAGKTLAMLAFALRHAALHKAHGFQRIIVVIPFLTIIEQTARIYRELLAPQFGEHYVLEDHSLAGLREAGKVASGDVALVDQDDPTSRLLAENWDAPIIVTTSVKCLESLFACRPAACRKLHRYARSIILFDEVQTLPAHLAVATLGTLSRLAERYGTTVVFSTATQPAFDHLDSAVKAHCASGWQPREIVPESLGLFRMVGQRTRVEWPGPQALDWDTLATQLAGHPQVLCIVNLKRHARALMERLSRQGPAGLFHLSTNMCPAHRDRVLGEVRRRLPLGEPCRLISTQCVEAGVDVDFPVVYRAFGPLEAIAQAAGRCNRNGRLDRPGRLCVFMPPEDGGKAYPPGGYAEAASITQLFLKTLRQAGQDPAELDLINNPARLREYYRLLYTLTTPDNPSRKSAQELYEAIQARDFAGTAELYRLIDKDAVNVLVPYKAKPHAALMEDLAREGHLTAKWIRQARRYAVSLFRPWGRDLWNCLRPLGVSDRPGASDQPCQWYALMEEQPGQFYDSQLLGLKELEDSWIC